MRSTGAEIGTSTGDMLRVYGVGQKGDLVVCDWVRRDTRRSGT